MITAPEEWTAILDHDERLLWVGSPATGLRFTTKSLFGSAFGLFFLAFALFWTAGAATPLFMMATGQGVVEGPRLFFYIFPLWGLPFILVGAYMTFGHYFYDASRRKRTRFALTTKRALITRWTRKKRELLSYPITPETVIDYQPGDETTIYFANKVTTDSDGDRHVEKIGFEHVPDGAAAYSVIRRIQTGAT
ncbi:MAG: hypothetical protein ABI459_02575 [Deltaproteobacteria bacterium]